MSGNWIKAIVGQANHAFKGGVQSLLEKYGRALYKINVFSHNLDNSFPNLGKTALWIIICLPGFVQITFPCRVHCKSFLPSTIDSRAARLSCLRNPNEKYFPE